MGCGSSKSTELTVPQITPSPRKLKEDTPAGGQVLTSPTPHSTDGDSRIAENVQVTNSSVVDVKADRVIRINTDTTPVESPCRNNRG